MDNKLLVAKFENVFGGGEAVRLFSAAGRVNLIGEHIDYNGGNVFPAALDLNCKIAVRKNNLRRMRLAFTTLEGVHTIELDSLDSYRQTKYINYQAGTAYVLQGEGYDIVGCDMLYDITVPFGSGLSSSAAIEVATAYTLMTLHNEQNGITTPVDKVRAAVLSQRAENKYVGVNSGIMDQFASAMGKKNHAILLNCSDLSYAYAPLELGEYSLVIANTNKPHDLVESKYNQRRSECEKALALLQTRVKGLKHLCELSADSFEAESDCLDSVLYNRAKHCVYEQDRVLRSVDALNKGDIKTFGGYLTASHKSLKELYEVTGSELDAMAETAIKLDGCIGARMTGAGFGGCVVALVRTDCVERFERALGKEYKRLTGLEASYYNTSIDDGAGEIIL